MQAISIAEKLATYTFVPTELIHNYLISSSVDIENASFLSDRLAILHMNEAISSRELDSTHAPTLAFLLNNSLLGDETLPQHIKDELLLQVSRQALLRRAGAKSSEDSSGWARYRDMFFHVFGPVKEGRGLEIKTQLFALMKAGESGESNVDELIEKEKQRHPLNALLSDISKVVEEISRLLPPPTIHKILDDLRAGLIPTRESAEYAIEKEPERKSEVPEIDGQQPAGTTLQEAAVQEGPEGGAALQHEEAHQAPEVPERPELPSSHVPEMDNDPDILELMQRQLGQVEEHLDQVNEQHLKTDSEQVEAASFQRPDKLQVKRRVKFELRMQIDKSLSTEPVKSEVEGPNVGAQNTADDAAASHEKTCDTADAGGPLSITSSQVKEGSKEGNDDKSTHSTQEPLHEASKNEEVQAFADADQEKEDGNASSEKESLESEEENDDVCRKCGMEGKLVCCDSCPAAYHLNCAGLVEVPEDEWLCPNCLAIVMEMHDATPLNTLRKSQSAKKLRIRNGAQLHKDGVAFSPIMEQQHVSRADGLEDAAGPSGAMAASDSDLNEAHVTANKGRKKGKGLSNTSSAPVRDVEPIGASREKYLGSQDPDVENGKKSRKVRLGKRRVADAEFAYATCEEVDDWEKTGEELDKDDHGGDLPRQRRTKGQPAPRKERVTRQSQSVGRDVESQEEAWASKEEELLHRDSRISPSTRRVARALAGKGNPFPEVEMEHAETRRLQMPRRRLSQKYPDKDLPSAAISPCSTPRNERRPRKQAVDNISEMFSCCECGEPLTRSGAWAFCEDCKASFHAKCSMETIVVAAGPWFCNACNRLKQLAALEAVSFRTTKHARMEANMLRRREVAVPGGPPVHAVRKRVMQSQDNSPPPLAKRRRVMGWEFERPGGGARSAATYSPAPSPSFTPPRQRPQRKATLWGGPELSKQTVNNFPDSRWSPTGAPRRRSMRNQDSVEDLSDVPKHVGRPHFKPQMAARRGMEGPPGNRKGERENGRMEAARGVTAGQHRGESYERKEAHHRSVFRSGEGAERATGFDVLNLNSPEEMSDSHRGVKGARFRQGYGRGMKAKTAVRQPEVSPSGSDLLPFVASPVGRKDRMARRKSATYAREGQSAREKSDGGHLQAEEPPPLAEEGTGRQATENPPSGSEGESGDAPAPRKSKQQQEEDEEWTAPTSEESLPPHPPVSMAPNATKPRRKNVRFTAREEATLRSGVARFGEAWATILEFGRDKFNAQRTSVDLKDKWRNLRKYDSQ